MAGTVKQAVAVWKGGLEFEGRGQSGATLAMAPDGVTFRPAELVLVGLAGCTGMDVADILRKKRQDVTALEVQVTGHQAETQPAKYVRIHINYVVTGRKVDSEAVRRSIELSEEKYCSVAASLRGVAEITTGFEVREAEPAA